MPEIILHAHFDGKQILLDEPYNITSQIFVFLAKNFKHEDTKKMQRAQRKIKIIIIFYIRDLSVRFVTLC